RENAERERERVVSKQAAMEARLRADEALRVSLRSHVGPHRREAVLPLRERERVVSKQAAMEARLRADEALRESEEKLRLLLDSTAEAIYGIDLEHRCTFCNPACLRALGYEHIEQVLGKNMHQLLHHSRADGTLFPVEECRVHRVTQTGEGVHAEDEVFWRA